MPFAISSQPSRVEVSGDEEGLKTIIELCEIALRDNVAQIVDGDSTVVVIKEPQWVPR